MRPSRRVRLRRLLLVLPLLLLVPLGVAKWRADHPPLSMMDKVLRTSMGSALEVRVTGWGTHWRHLTGLLDNGSIFIVLKDRAMFHQLTEELRCQEQGIDIDPRKFSNIILLHVWYGTEPHTKVRLFSYFQNETGAYLQVTNGNLFDHKGMRVHPHFAPRFEAVVADLAQRAQAPGHHPEITLEG